MPPKSKGGKGAGGNAWKSGDDGEASKPEFKQNAWTKGDGPGAGPDVKPPQVKMPPLWQEFSTPDGIPYYYNAHTGLTQWSKPSVLERPSPKAPETRPANEASARTGRLSSGADRETPHRRTTAELWSERAEERDQRLDRGDRDMAERRERGGDRGDDRGGKGSFDRGGVDRGGARTNNKRSAKGGGGKGDESGRGGGGKGGGSGGKGGGGGGEAHSFGPPGCNLFVFHLPDDWQDEDLLEYFGPHGKVVSSKVMKEVGTGRSRGFGFVSYEDRVAAATAIKKMQGYKVLGKRLKVEFKKGEGESNDEPGPDAPGSAQAPDDERLIGYLKAISAKNAVISLKDQASATGKEERSGQESADEDF